MYMGSANTARVVNSSRSNDDSVDAALTSNGTSVYDSSVQRRPILPPATSVEAIERIGVNVNSADHVTTLRSSPSTLTSRESADSGVPVSYTHLTLPTILRV